MLLKIYKSLLNLRSKFYAKKYKKPYIFKIWLAQNFLTENLPRYNDDYGKIIKYSEGDILECFRDNYGSHLYFIKKIEEDTTKAFCLPYDDTKIYWLQYFKYDKNIKR